MAYVGDTGQGATVTLDTTGAVGCIRTCDLPEQTQESIDASCLETTDFMHSIPADLTDPGECTMTAVFDATNVLPLPGVVETLTITLPIGTDGNTTAGEYTGTGFLTSVNAPNLATSELMELQMTFKFDGDTGPTYTPEAA